MSNLKKGLIFILFSIFIVILFFTLNFIPDKKFVINGEVEGNYTGVIYLNYDNKKDSCIISNGKFYFEGKILNGNNSLAKFSTKNISAMDNFFFVENRKIKIKLIIENRKVNNTSFDWLILDKISGTKTKEIEDEYNDYVSEIKNQENFQEKEYEKIEELVLRYPKNQYLGALILKKTQDSLSNLETLKKIYNKLNLKFQDKNIIESLQVKFSSQNSIKYIENFTLKNRHGKLINTKTYGGNYLIVDFWASWCSPCRKQIPKLNEIYNNKEYKNLKILSVSIDEEYEMWLKAINEEQMRWENVIIDEKSKKRIKEYYKLDYIPKLFLIDPNGNIVVQDKEINEIENYLKINLKK